LLRPRLWVTYSPMLVTPPIIARLLLRPRKWAQRRVTSGAFGPVVRRRGRAQLVALAAVETYNGRPFTEAQLADVGIERETDDGT
jgi:hypothetical protein